jgi:hypothetical protein
MRILSAVLIALVAFLAVPAAGQGVPSPQTHAATGLKFPSTVGEARLTHVYDYAKSHGKPALGFAYGYSIPGLLGATVYVYDLDQSVPDGADSLVVKAQFDQAYRDIEQAAQSGRYRDLKEATPPGLCRHEPLVLNCVTFSATLASNNARILTRLLVTGHRAHFIKLRIDWAPGPAVNEAAIGRFLQGLVTAMMDR